MGYKAEVLADSPIRYWKLDDSTGVDTTGNGNLTKGTSTAAPTTGAAGQNGTAWSFDGGDEATFAMPTLTTTFTLEMFFKSNGATKASHTFWRADGVDVAVIRMQGTGSTYPGQIYGVIGTASFNTGTAYNDNAWHHLVVVVNGVSIKVYVDNVLKNDITTGKTSYSFGPTGYVGRPLDGTTTEYLIGSLDEFAVYNTVLSATRVSAHYAARAAVDGAYTATPATASGLMTNAIVPKNVGVAVPVATASGSMADPYRLKTKGVDASQDQGTTGTYGGSSTDLYIGGSPAFIQFPDPGLPSDAQIVKVSLVLNKISGSAGSTTVQIGKVTSAWTENDNYSIFARPSYTMTGAVSGDVPQADVTLTYDITSLGLNANGYALTAGYNFDVSSSETASAPRLIVDYKSEGATSQAILPFVGSGASVDPSVSVAIGVSVAAGVATGSGLVLAPVVAGESHPDATVLVEPFTASAAMGNGGFAVPVGFTAVAMTADGLVLAPSLTTDKNAVVKAGPGVGNGVLNAPLEALNANADPYYNRVKATTAVGDIWFRLDETSGAVAHALEGGTGAAITGTSPMVGTYNWNVYGPEGRKSVHFDNGYLDFNHQYNNQFEFTFETTIRTNQKSGLLVVGQDGSNITTGMWMNSIYLKDGKVAFNWTANGATREVVGIADIADGQWHHVVVSWGKDNAKTLDNGFRVYIDGKLDVRRSYDVQAGAFPVAIPDYFFGMPDSAKTNFSGFTYAPNFVGDVMEFVLRNADLVADDAAELYYTVFGIVPVRAGVATGSASMGETIGKGNQKRALMLYFAYDSGASGAYGAVIPAGDEQYASGVYRFPGDYEMGPDIDIPGDTGFKDKLEVDGYRVFYAPVLGEQRGGGAAPYRDYVTDEPRLLNVMDDLDTDQFDLIFFRNWPDEGVEIDRLAVIGYTPSDLEDVLTSIRKAQDEKGISFWITSPTLAAQYGLISRADLVSTMYEQSNVFFQGNAAGDYDPRSADIDPWLNARNPTQDLAGGTPDTAKYFYRDEHRNNRQRLVANIAGLTDTPGDYLADALIRDQRNNGDVSGLFAQKFADRSNGLGIGDEWIDTTAFYGDLDTKWLRTGYQQRLYNTYAIPSSAVLAGTPVTKFSAKVWQGRESVDNPYADYVGTLVVQPGDSVKGSPIGGKVFVNLSEDPTNAFATFEWRRQIVPANDQIADSRDWETDEMRSWDYSFYRIIIGGSGSTTTNSVTLTENADGTFSFVSKNGPDAAMVNIAEKYPTQRVLIKTMTNRGLEWLAIREEVAEGGKVIRIGAANGSGAMPTTATRVEKSVVVNAQAAVSVATMVNPDEVLDPDVTVLVLPGTGSGTIVNYEKKIVVAPFEGSAAMTENAEVQAQRDSIVLYLMRPEQIILTKEEN